MRLLPPEAFAPVYEPLVGKRVGFIRPIGNVGDQLIEMATLQLFNEYGIRCKHQDPNEPLDESLDLLVYGGGGNMGTLYMNNWELRSRIRRFGLPITIFPQSFSSEEGRDYAKVYVRERASLGFCPAARLAPDLPLGLEWTERIAPVRDTGVFLRRDGESAVRRRWWRSDPARVCRTPVEYLRLAARYRRIITDRLHFAISGLIVGREVTLLPNSYHKNRSMHETWLVRFGCRFAQSVKEALAGFVASRAPEIRWQHTPLVSFSSRIPSKAS